VFATEQTATGFSDTKISQHKTVDADHDRIESRNYTVIHDVDWLQEDHEWPGLKSVVMFESEREIPATARNPAKIERETRFYITSLAWLACQVAPTVRGGLHWLKNTMFRDDECRVCTDHAPANFTPQPNPMKSVRQERGIGFQRAKRRVLGFKPQLRLERQGEDGQLSSRARHVGFVLRNPSEPDVGQQAMNDFVNDNPWADRWPIDY
jgi:hypothetical protein